MIAGRLRSVVVSWLARRYLARAGANGIDLSMVRLLPESALMPLRRDGLDPVPALGVLRRESPVSKLRLPLNINVWLVTGIAEVKAVLGNADGYSTDFANFVGKAAFSADSNPGGLGMADPPAHTRLRRLLTPEFTMRRLSRLAPRIESIVADQLDAMAQAQEPVDLVEAFALPIPSLVICELLGVPYEDRDEFQRMATARFDLFGGAGAAIGAVSQSLTYLAGVVASQRDSPGDGLLGMIIKEHGDEIDDVELAGLADGVLTGGFETTASMIALGALVLLQDAEAFALVRDDDSAISGVVEELLRYLSVVQVAFPRVARDDIEVAGQRISRGDIVVCSLSGSNRDDALVADAEHFRPARPAAAHVAFGHGIHRCIGAELARMELRVAFPALVRRFPNMCLDPNDGSLTYRSSSIVYGAEPLRVLLK